MNAKETVVIVGGNFVNKGAHLMVSVAIEIAKSCGNNVTPIVLDSFPITERETEYKYKGVRVLSVPFHLSFAYCMLNGMSFSPILLMRVIKSFLTGFISGKSFQHIKNGVSALRLIEKSAYVLDISGYGYNSSSGMMNFIQLSFCQHALKNSVPYVYFPQSFGPFDKKKYSLNLQIEQAVESATYVFCRERSSMNELDSLSDNYSGGYWPDIALLYGKKEELKTKLGNVDMELITGSIVLIPNARLYDKYSESHTNDLYNILISNLLSLGHKVTVLKHSADDMDAVRYIQNKYLKKVYVLDSDYDLSTIDDVIASSKLVISARYHGLIVSLKNAIPCMAIGWAHKYDELLGIYGLEKNNFDLSKKIDTDEVFSRLKSAINTSSCLAKNIEKTNYELLCKYPLSKFISLIRDK